MAKGNNNNGLTNNFYRIEKWVKDVDDLAESLNLTGNLFNILKGIFSTKGDRHAGTNQIRDSFKMIHYSIRHTLSLKRKDDRSISTADILVEIYKQLDEKEKKKVRNKIKNI